MKDRWQRQLKKELTAAGATDSELSELVPVAGSLKLLKGEMVTPKLGLKLRWPALTLVAGVCACLALVIVSQSALPTSWLFPVQKLSDNVAVAVHPQYRATVMMRSARQVNQLITAHAEPKVVLATLADYDSEAVAYKSMIHTNYAAFEYCKARLSQAATVAPPNVHQAIDNSLQALGNT